MEDNLVICIAANKQDLSSERRVVAAKVNEYAESIGAQVFETSARINSGVEEMFLSVATNLVTQHALSMQRGASTGISSLFLFLFFFHKEEDDDDECVVVDDDDVVDDDVGNDRESADLPQRVCTFDLWRQPSSRRQPDIKNSMV